jgi:hypothetical protein
MILSVSEKSMRRTVPFLTVFTILAVLSLCVTSAAYSAAPSLKTYSVTLTASPKSQTAAPGGKVSVTITEKNTGSSPFKVTGCVTEVATSSSGPFSSIGCTLTAPYSISAHGSTKASLSFSFSTTAAPGKYYFKFYDTGKVGSSSYETKTTTFTVTVS